MDAQNNPVKLKVSDLRSNIRLFEGGNWIKLSDKFSNPDHEMDAAYIIVHDKTTKENGLMRIDNVKNILPSGIQEGYYDSSSGKVYNNILVSDARGNYLYSRIELSSFIQQGDGWYKDFTGTNGKLQKEVNIVFGLTASNQYLCFLFDASIRINPQEIDLEYLPGVKRLTKPKTSIKYEYLPTDPDPDIYGGLSMTELDIRAVSSIVYQFDQSFLAISSTRKGIKLDNPTRVLLSNIFLNLYPHENTHYSLSHYSNIFGNLGITSQQLKEIVPMSLSSYSSSPSPTLVLSANRLYSPKRFYKIFQEALVAKADLLRARFLIDIKTYEKIQTLNGFSDTYLNNLNNQDASIERRDEKEIILVDSILTDIIGYSGYTIIKSGFMTIEKTNQGYEFSAFAPNADEKSTILRLTCVLPVKLPQITMRIGPSYFRKRENTKLFFIDLLINGHKQGFSIEGEVAQIYTRPKFSLGEAIFGDSFKGQRNVAAKMSQAFLRMYGDLYIPYFSKDTSSDLIVSGRRVVFQQVWKLLKDRITDSLIIRKFPQVINEIMDPSVPITYTRAVEIVKDLVLNYYFNYYLDSIYASLTSKKYDYITQVYQMIRKGTTSAIFEGKAKDSSHNFFSSSDSNLIFNLNGISGNEIIDIIMSLTFNHRSTIETDATNYRSDWSLSLSSVRSEIKDATIKTFGFLQDIFNNYDPTVKHFSIYFHKPSTSGINHHTNLNDRISGSYTSEEIEGTFIDVDRSDPQSVIDAIASTVFYMLKYNAFVLVKEGLKSQVSNTVVMCFDQRKIYRPDILKTIFASGVQISNKFLSPYSETQYNNWASQYDGKIFSAGNIYPLYLFHDVSDLPQLIVDNLRIFLRTKAQIIKLM